MTTLLHLRQTVAADHQIHLVLPPDFPVGEVEVTVRSTAADTPRSGNVAVATVYDQLFADAQHQFTPFDRACFEAATALRAEHGLKTPDALHRAAALQAGCDEFWTNDQRLAQAAQGRLRIVNLLSASAG